MRHSVAGILRRIGAAILRVAAPARCICCGAFDTWLCAQCASALPRPDTQSCPVCRTPSHGGTLCIACHATDAPDALFVAYQRHPVLRTAIHTFKYGFIPGLHVPLGDILADALADGTLPLPDIVTSVPLHPRRERWRGFNQSALLARRIPGRLAPHLHIPLYGRVLARTRYTAPQVGQSSRDARIANLTDAFAVTDPSLVAGKTVLVIDDVATTGTTLAQCARALRTAGARRVYAAVLVRD